jgi:hypothetical protein
VSGRASARIEENKSTRRMANLRRRNYEFAGDATRS